MNYYILNLEGRRYKKINKNAYQILNDLSVIDKMRYYKNKNKFILNKVTFLNN